MLSLWNLISQGTNQWADPSKLKYPSSLRKQTCGGNFKTEGNLLTIADPNWIRISGTDIFNQWDAEWRAEIDFKEQKKDQNRRWKRSNLENGAQGDHGWDQLTVRLPA